MYLYYGYGMFFDPTYFLVIAGVMLSLAASAYLKSTYSKYNKVCSMSGYTGAQAAERILHTAGIYDVTIEHISGDLTDHYDPRTKTLRLSDTVYGSNSVAALGVAAHECGHAMQHDKGYVPIKLRALILPVANIGSQLSWPLILLGIILGYSKTLIMIGIVLFAAAVLFQLVTLPVEFNASSRAAIVLGETGILQSQEVGGAKKVLKAAAMTYVAGAAGMILQLLRLLILFGGRRND